MKIARGIAAVVLVMLLMATHLMITAQAYEINPTDPLTADMNAGIRLAQKSYDPATGILTILISGKLSNTEGYSSVGVLVTFDNTKLMLINHPEEYPGGDGVIVPDNERISIMDTHVVTKARLTRTGIQARPYETQNQDVYKSGTRTAFYTFIHNTGTAPNDAQKTLNWIPIMEMCFKVTGAPSVLSSFLNRDSLRFGDVKKDQTVMDGVFQSKSEYSVTAISYISPAQYFYFSPMSETVLPTPNTPEKKIIPAIIEYDGSERLDLGSLTIDPISDIDVPTNDTAVTMTPSVIAKDVSGNIIATPALTWTFDPAVAPTGVTYNSSTGAVTVSKTAQAGTVSLIASSGGISSAAQTITIKKTALVATSMVVFKGSGTTPVTSDTITIPASGAPNTVTYNAKTYDQEGNEFPDTYTYLLTATGAADANVTNNGATVSVSSAANNGGTFDFRITSSANSSLSKIVAITVRGVEITWPQITPKATPVYGDSWSQIITLTGGAATLNSANIPGTFYISDASGNAIGANRPNAGNGTPYYITFKSTDGVYTIVSSVKNISINPKQIMLGVTPISKEYNESIPTFNATAASGSLVGSDTIADLGLTLVTAAKKGDAPGSYAVTLSSYSNTNYSISVEPNTAFTITKAALTLTGTPSYTPILANAPANATQAALVADVNSKIPTLTASYANGTSTLNATWTLSNGTFNPKGGTYTFTATLTPSNSTNFSYTPVAPVTVSVTVTPVTGIYNYSPLALQKVKAEIETAANMAALGLPTQITIVYDKGVSEGTYAITAWTPTLAQLKAIDVSSGDVVRELIPTVTFPEWATIDASGLKTTLTITNKYPVTINVTPPSGVTYGTTLGNPTASQTAISNGIDPSATYSYQYSGTTRAGIAYSSATKPTQAGSYTVTATLISNTHSGSGTSAAFVINPKPLVNSMINITGSYTYTGSPIIPNYTISDGSLLNAADYNVAITDNINPGTAKLTATATVTGNYSGSATQSFIINPANQGDDYGNTFNDAYNWILTPGIPTNSINGRIDYSADVDMLRFTANTTGTCTISTSNIASTIVYLDIYLYDSSQVLLTRKLAYFQSTVSFQYTLNAGQVYYLKVDGYSGTGAYTINITDIIVNADYTISYNANGGQGAPANQLNPTHVTTSTPATPKSYTVIFNANEGNAISPSGKQVYCTFKNWNTNASGSGTSYDSGAPYTAGISAVLFAQWNDPAIGELPLPTRAAYIFRGWFTERTGGSLVTPSTIITGDITIYAQWELVLATHTVTFDANNGAGKMADQTFMSGLLQALNANSFVRTNYTFKGWALSKDAAVTYVDRQLIAVAGDITLYAVWEYSGGYDDYGNTFGDAFNWTLTQGISTNSKDGVINYAQDIDILKFTANATGLYTFSTSNLASTIVYLDVYLYNSSQVLVSRKLSSFNSAVSFQYSLEAGQVYYLKMDGYSGTGAYTVNITEPVSAVKYYVTFGASDGTGTMTNQEFTSGVAQALKANSFTKVGYIFKGWAVSQDTAVIYVDRQVISIIGNISLFAVWERDAAYDDYGNTFEDAFNWTLTSDVTNSRAGIINYSKDADMLKFTANVSGKYTFFTSDLASSILYLDVYLYDSAQNLISRKLAGYYATVSFEYTLNAGQVYYLKVDGYSGTGAYTINITRPTSTVILAEYEAVEGMIEPEGQIDPTVDVTSSIATDVTNDAEIAKAPNNAGSEAATGAEVGTGTEAEVGTAAAAEVALEVAADVEYSAHG